MLSTTRSLLLLCCGVFLVALLSDTAAALAAEAPEKLRKNQEHNRDMRERWPKATVVGHRHRLSVCCAPQQMKAHVKTTSVFNGITDVNERDIAMDAKNQLYSYQYVQKTPYGEKIWRKVIARDADGFGISIGAKIDDISFVTTFPLVDFKAPKICVPGNARKTENPRNLRVKPDTEVVTYANSDCTFTVTKEDCVPVRIECKGGDSEFKEVFSNVKVGSIESRHFDEPKGCVYI